MFSFRQLLLLILLAASIPLWKTLRKKPAPAIPNDQKSVTEKQPPPHTEPLLGEIMLEDFGLPETPPAMDTKLAFDFIQASSRENRHLDTVHFSTNPSLTEILLGKEGMSYPQLPSKHRILGRNQYGEQVLVDRWSTPFHIHLVERYRIEIRSAGPDKKMGTEDDLFWPKI